MIDCNVVVLPSENESFGGCQGYVIRAQGDKYLVELTTGAHVTLSADRLQVEPWECEECSGNEDTCDCDERDMLFWSGPVDDRYDSDMYD